jgi:hypothetical protein
MIYKLSKIGILVKLNGVPEQVLNKTDHQNAQTLKFSLKKIEKLIGHKSDKNCELNNERPEL